MLGRLGWKMVIDVSEGSNALFFMAKQYKKKEGFEYEDFSLLPQYR
jgi:hypothetical protein